MISQSHVKYIEIPGTTLYHLSARNPRSGLMIATSVSVHNTARGQIQGILKGLLLYGRKTKRPEY